MPRTADTAKVLEKAQAALEARKEGRARKRRKGIFTLMIVAIIVFVATAGYMSWQLAQKNNQQKQQDQAKQSVLETLEKFDPVKDYSDADKGKLYEKVGAEYAAAEAIGIGLDSDNPNDITELNKQLRLNKDPESVANALKAIIDMRLEQVNKDGYYEGYVFYYCFGNTAIAWSDNSKIPNHGSAEALATDKKYASDRANEDMSGLKGSSLYPDQVLQKIRADERLKLHEDPNGSSYVSSIIVSQSRNSSIYGHVVDVIKEMGKVGYSEIKTSTYVSVYDKSKTPMEACYYFVKLDKYVKGQTAIDEYQKALTQMQGDS